VEDGTPEWDPCSASICKGGCRYGSVRKPRRCSFLYGVVRRTGGQATQEDCQRRIGKVRVILQWKQGRHVKFRMGMRPLSVGAAEWPSGVLWGFESLPLSYKHTTEEAVIRRIWCFLKHKDYWRLVSMHSAGHVSDITLRCNKCKRTFRIEAKDKK